MSAETILVAAWSGRMLAASARRAGSLPPVVDAFGDDDTRASAAGIEVLPGAFPRGFEATSLIAALDRLAARAATPPIGLVLGSGFEAAPDSVAALAKRWRLLGCDADCIRACKDPKRFFPLLRRLGITHPETRLDPPTGKAGDKGGDNWLVRRSGGSGGTHIRLASDKTTHANCYFQRRMQGIPISVSGVVGGRGGAALAFTRQWTNPTRSQPFRFGGAVGPATLDPDLEARMIEDAMTLTEELRLVGLVSFDFLAVDGAPVLLEINPRPSATLDILDGAHGAMFRAHVAACLGEGSVSDIVAADPQPDDARAVGYLYADRGTVTIPPRFEWPDWIADRSPAGTRVPQGAPLATVFAEGRGLDVAVRRLGERSRHLETMLYPEQNKRQ